jgi:nitrous oxidase accessory protein
MSRLIGIILSASWALCFSVAAYAHDWQVTPDGEALSAVLGKAAAGDRLRIAPGHYRANLLIDKPVVLEGAPGAILDGGGHGDVIRIRSRDVTIRGLLLQHSGRNLTEMNAVIFVERSAERVRIEDNQLRSDAFGIWVDGSRDAHIADNRIHGDASICGTAYTTCTRTTTKLWTTVPTIPARVTL